MALYSYIKQPKKRPGLKLSPRLARLFSITFLLLGVFLIAQVIVPIFGWYVLLVPQFTSEIASPLASSYVPPLSPKEVRAQDSGSAAFNSDPYRPSTWFASPGPANLAAASNLRTYTLSIPKLKIDGATVEMGGDNLKKSLIAWPTSALPGSYGVNIIFGHSELPSLANPKDYSGIFTFIMDLGEGDAIFVDSDGIRYKYEVFDKKVVEPTDLSVLEQRFDRAYLTLITCIPPGTLWKRGVVKARLVQI